MKKKAVSVQAAPVAEVETLKPEKCFACYEKATGRITQRLLLSGTQPDPIGDSVYGFVAADPSFDLTKMRVQGGSLVDAGEDPLEAPRRAAAARQRRDQLLTRSDWTQVPDSPLSPTAKQDWAEYRQALRDWTDTPGFPDLTTLPTPPLL